MRWNSFSKRTKCQCDWRLLLSQPRHLVVFVSENWAQSFVQDPSVQQIRGSCFFLLNSAKNWYQFCWIYHVVPFFCRFQRKFAQIFMWTKQWTQQFFAEIGENWASNCNYSESSENLQKFNGIRDMWDFFWKPSELAEPFENVHLGRLFLIAEIFAEFGEIKELGREKKFNFSPKSPKFTTFWRIQKFGDPPPKKWRGWFKSSLNCCSKSSD